MNEGKAFNISSSREHASQKNPVSRCRDGAYMTKFREETGLRAIAN